MAYTKTKWNANDLVTAIKMNNIEDGIVGLENIYSNIMNNIDNNSTNIALINNKIGENYGTIGTINERIKTNVDNIGANTNKIKIINNEITSLHQEDVSINDRIDQIENISMSEDNKLNTQIEGLKNQGVTGYKGQYNENTTYKLGDIVSYELNFYVYKNTNESNNQTPGNESNYWEQVDTVTTGPTIEIGDQVPTNTNVKLWIDTSEKNKYEVPTIEEFSVDVERHTLNILYVPQSQGG